MDLYGGPLLSNKHFNPTEPWLEQVNYGDDRVGDKFLYWSQPEYRYRILFSPVIREFYGNGRLKDCHQDYAVLMTEHGPRLEMLLDCMFIVSNLVLVMYFNGDYQDVVMHLKLQDLSWMVNQIRYVEGYGDGPLDYLGN